MLHISRSITSSPAAPLAPLISKTNSVMAIGQDTCVRIEGTSGARPSFESDWPKGISEGRLGGRLQPTALEGRIESIDICDIMAKMKQRVYTETTIISYLTGRPSRDLVIAAHQELTRQWWETRSSDFELFVSELVREEVAMGDAKASDKRMGTIAEMPILRTTEEAVSLAERLVSMGPIPHEAAADALHIAIAAVNGVDYLLTWNCKHMANATLRSRIEAKVEEAGYACPVICTPEELMEDQP